MGAPAVYADEAFALALWDNMFLPEDKKKHNMDLNEMYLACPGPDDYIQ